MNCNLSLKVANTYNQPVAGIAVKVARVMIDGEANSDYLADKITDADGRVEFTVPAEAYITLGCDESAKLNGARIIVPNALEHFLGVFHADPATVSRANSGTPSALAGVSVTEYGDQACRQVLIELDHVPITVGNTTGVSFGGVKVFELPKGRALIHGVTVNDVSVGLDNEGNDTPIAGTMGGDFALGSTAPSDGTLTGTDVNLCPSTSIDPISDGVAAAELAASARLDGSSSPISVYFNMLIDDGDVADEASDVLEISAKILITYSMLGIVA